jgi:prepilin-type N-terminal cleavage/methylation domain-containing protein
VVKRGGGKQISEIIEEELYMKKLKGFTLIECIVAMTIFAIASLTIAQVYITVSTIQKENEFMQYSLANQMKYVEDATGSDASSKVQINYNGTGTGGAASTGVNGNARVKLVKVDLGTDNNFDGLNFNDDEATGQEYFVGVNMFVFKSREGSSHSDDSVTYDDTSSTRANTDESNGNLRYKFMTPKT